MAISTEGKIGIALSLLFAGGGGASATFPGQPWIGAATMIVAADGVLWLALHHFGLGVRRAVPIVVVCGCALAAGALYWRSSVPAGSTAPAFLKDFKYVFSCPRKALWKKPKDAQNELEQAQQSTNPIDAATDRITTWKELDNGFQIEIEPKPGTTLNILGGLSKLTYDIRLSQWETLVDVIMTIPVPPGIEDHPQPEPTDAGAESIFVGMTHSVEGITGSPVGTCKLL